MTPAFKKPEPRSNPNVQTLASAPRVDERPAREHKRLMVAGAALAGVAILAGSGVLWSRMPSAETRRACEIYAEAGGGLLDKAALEADVRKHMQTVIDSQSDDELAAHNLTREEFRRTYEPVAMRVYANQVEKEDAARVIVAARMNWSAAEVERTIKSCPKQK